MIPATGAAESRRNPNPVQPRRHGRIGQRLRRWPRAGALVAVVAIAAIVWPMFGPAMPVDAHAVVISTTPPAGATLSAPPTEVAITFNEPISIDDGSIVVINAAGDRVSEPPVASGTTISAAIAQDATGWHAVSWYGVSTDGHPVSGAWTFRIGEGDDAAPEGLESRAAAASRTSDAARWSFFITQGLSTLAAVIVLGTLFVMAVAFPTTELSRLALRTTWVGIVMSFLAAGANGPYASVGTGWFSGPSSAEYAGRTLLLVLVAAILLGLRLTGRQTQRSPLASIGPLVLGSAALGIPVLSGHAPAESTSATFAVIIHLVVAGCWLGAIPALITATRSGDADSATVLSRFSRAAAWLLAGTLVAGGASTILLTGGINNATQSWGLTLFAKIGLVALAAAAGAWNRWRVVPFAAGGTARDARPALRVEAVALVAVVALGVALTHNGPPRDATRSTGGPAIIDAMPSEDVRVQLIVDPARAGTNDLHLFVLDAAGQPVDAEEVTITVRSDALDIGDITITPSNLGAGHYSTRTSDLGIAGTWQVAIVVRPDTFTQVEVDEEIVIAP